MESDNGERLLERDNGEQPFACSQCDETFAHVHSVRVHRVGILRGSGGKQVVQQCIQQVPSAAVNSGTSCIQDGDGSRCSDGWDDFTCIQGVDVSTCGLAGAIPDEALGGHITPL